jgi:hypothetical protein
VGDETLSTAILRALTHRISAHAVSAQVAQDDQNSQDAFTPQSIGVIGSMELANALQLALVDIPGDYSILRFDETLKLAKALSTQPPLKTPSDVPHDPSYPNFLASDSPDLNSPELNSPGLNSPGPNSPGTRAEEELVPKDRPLRALIIEQFESLASSSPQARNRLLMPVNFVQRPFAIFVPPTNGWTESTKDRSRWIEQIEANRIEWIEEIEVLTHQFAINFEFWSGYEAPLDSIRESLEEYLQW